MLCTGAFDSGIASGSRRGTCSMSSALARQPCVRFKPALHDTTNRPVTSAMRSVSASHGGDPRPVLPGSRKGGVRVLDMRSGK
jgi:hypothetical protein